MPEVEIAVVEAGAVAASDGLGSPCSLSLDALRVCGVTPKDVVAFLAAAADLVSVAPMCAAFADVVESRRRKARVCTEAPSDVSSWPQRNSLCFALAQFLSPPSEDGPCAEAAISLDAPEPDAGGGDPLWYVIDCMIVRRAQQEHGAEEPLPTPGHGTEDAHTHWQEFWTYYRKAAHEVAPSSSHAKNAPAGPCASARLKSKAASTISALHGDASAAHTHRLHASSLGPRTAMALQSPSACGNGSGCGREGQPAARQVLPVVERIKLEQQQFERRASVAEQHAPGASAERQNSWQNVSDESDAESSGEEPLLDTPSHDRRKAKFRLWLPELRSPAEQEKRTLRSFKGFDDYKQRQGWLTDVPCPKPKAVSAPARGGLALNRLPAKPDEPAYEAPASRTVFEVCQKEYKVVQEAMQEMAGRSQQQWTTPVREYAAARAGRQEPELESGHRPRPFTPRPKQPPSVAHFRRPWSREGTAEGSKARSKSDGYLTPIQRFAKVCRNSGVHPQHPSVRFLASLPPKLDIRGSGYSDEDLLALAAALPFSGRIEAADLGENSRLSDTSACSMLSVLAKRHQSSLRALSLDQCGRLGTETITLCTRFLKGPFTCLQSLNLSGITIAMHEYRELASALEVHPQMRTVKLAKTGLGCFSQSHTVQVIASLIGNPRIGELELGWNSLSFAAFDVLGKGMEEHTNLTSLGLANTGPCPDREHGVSPIMAFLEHLCGDRALTSLDVSHNTLDGSAPLLLEHALRQHPRLEYLDVSRNPLGPDGMRSVLRLLAHSECGELTKISADECEGGRLVEESSGFFDQDPSGIYSLNMASPTKRALLQLLLARLTERLPGAPLGSFFRCATLCCNGKEAAFNFDSLKRGKNCWPVPQAGKLCFELSADQVLLRAEDDSASPTVVIDRILRRSRMRLTGQRKVIAVLTFIKSACDDENRRILLDALSHDFLLTPEQVRALCHTQLKETNCGHFAAETCCRILPCITDALHIRQVILCTSTYSDLLRIGRSGKSLLSLNLENPTGRYDLDLSEPMERSTAERLLLLNRWQLHVWKASGLIDISQHGNGKSIRNEVFDNRAFVWRAEDWHLPFGGAKLSFDYVPLCRPPAGAKPVPADTWHEVLACLKGVIAGVPTHRKGPQGEALEAGSARTRAESVLWALRVTSHRFWLLCRQLRELLCIFHGAVLRADTLAYFFLRCLDWPVNEKLCRAKFSQEEWADLRKRLGYINLFPYFQPECLQASLNLAHYEQRRAMHFLVRLANSEDPRNIKKPRIDKRGMNNFEPFTAGIPMTWDQYDSIPAQGVVGLTYRCSMESARFRARRRLASSGAGWVNLPDDNATLQTLIQWWSVLTDVPMEVVHVMVFMVHHFNTLNNAFDVCDSNKDGLLNHKEFVSKLQSLGCSFPRRRAGSKVPCDPSFTAAIAADEDVLTSVYRYLDTSNDGDINKKEFEILYAMWREISQSLWECKTHLIEAYGSLDQAWDSAEINEAGVMGYSDFVRLVTESNFDGPLEQLFVYLDLNADECINRREWMQLELMKGPTM